MSRYSIVVGMIFSELDIELITCTEVCSMGDKNLFQKKISSNPLISCVFIIFWPELRMDLLETQCLNQNVQELLIKKWR